MKMKSIPVTSTGRSTSIFTQRRNNRFIKLSLLVYLLHLHDINISVFSLSNNSHRHETTSRRHWLSSQIVPTFVSIAAFTPIASSSSATTETVGKDPGCNDSTCLGVWDGLLADCPHSTFPLIGSSGCTCSQDDTPGFFSEPWDYSDCDNLNWEDQMKLLVPTIQLASSRRGDLTEIKLQSGRYLRILFTDGKTKEQSLGEFYFTPNDTTVQFRLSSILLSTSLSSSSSSASNNNKTYIGSFKNIDRAETIRKAMKYTKLIVLRNRSRTFFFGESDLDTFGPSSSSLGPPAEMISGELDGKEGIGYLKKKM